MGNLILSEVPSDILAEKVANIVIDRIKELIPVPEKRVNYITRQRAAELLNCTPPTIDTYAAESLIKKYGKGKRARFIEEEIEAAKPLIYSIKYKKKKY